MIRGVDASHYQGFPNWASLRDTHHLSFAAAKCTEGMNYFDSSYIYNRAGIRAAGLKVIPYHYAVPSASSAATQAARFVARAGDVDALCLDLEKSSLNQSQTNAWMRAFGDALRSLAPGVTTIAYLGGYAANGSGQSAVDHFDHWWYPRYPGLASWPTVYKPNPVGNTTGWKVPPAPAIWQFSDRVAGMDSNVSNLTIDELFNTGGTMPLDAADLDAVAHAVWAYNQAGARSQAWSYLQGAAGKPTAEQVAAAVIAKLPPANTGGISKDDVKAAVVDVLTNGTNGGTTS